MRSIDRLGRWTRGGLVLPALAVVPLLFAGTAVAAPPPGNLVVNSGFDTDTSGWGSFGGTLARTETGSPCANGNPGAATATVQTGAVYTISDSQGGNEPTVGSTIAGQTYIAFATVWAASASAAGKPARIILRERVGTAGTIIKETSTSFTMPPTSAPHLVVVSARAVKSGSTLGLRIEQSAATRGDAFSIDDVAVRIAARAFGAETPGTVWTTMSNDVSRVSVFSALGPDGQPDTLDRFLDRLRVYLDGRGGVTGSQKLRAVIYSGYGWSPGMDLVAVSRELTITSGTSARWVDFRFDAPPFLSGFEVATYQFGLLSGSTRNVARYASTSSPKALWWGADKYVDGPFSSLEKPDLIHPPATWSTDDKQMSIQGLAVPVGDGRSGCP
jgi:hypothetical protein